MPVEVLLEGELSVAGDQESVEVHLWERLDLLHDLGQLDPIQTDLFGLGDVAAESRVRRRFDVGFLGRGARLREHEQRHHFARPCGEPGSHDLDDPMIGHSGEAR